MANDRYCSRHPASRISSPDGQFDGVCGLCEMQSYEEDAVSDGAGGTVAAGSLDDPGVGTADPSDDPPLGTCRCGARSPHDGKGSWVTGESTCHSIYFCTGIEDDHADDERRYQQGR